MICATHAATGAVPAAANTIIEAVDVAIAPAAAADLRTTETGAIASSIAAAAATVGEIVAISRTFRPTTTLAHVSPDAAADAAAAAECAAAAHTGGPQPGTASVSFNAAIVNYAAAIAQSSASAAAAFRSSTASYATAVSASVPALDVNEIVPGSGRGMERQPGAEGAPAPSAAAGLTFCSATASVPDLPAASAALEAATTREPAAAVQESASSPSVPCLAAAGAKVPSAGLECPSAKSALLVADPTSAAADDESIASAFPGELQQAGSGGAAAAALAAVPLEPSAASNAAAALAEVPLTSSSKAACAREAGEELAEANRVSSTARERVVVRLERGVLMRLLDADAELRSLTAPGGGAVDYARVAEMAAECGRLGEALGVELVWEGHGVTTTGKE